MQLVVASYMNLVSLGLHHWEPVLEGKTTLVPQCCPTSGLPHHHQHH